MTSPVRVIEEIDHLLTYVRDGAAAEAFFRGLGFTLSPISHIAPMGIVNRLVLFPDTVAGSANFIELMSVSDAIKLPPQMAPLLSGADGVKSMVLSTADSVHCHQHLNALGYPFAVPVRVEREWALGDGTSVFPKFDVLLPVAAALTFNACQYYNSELYKRPSWTTHPNGVTGIISVLAVADDPERIAQMFASVFDACVLRHNGTWRVTRGKVTLDVSTPATFQADTGLAAPMLAPSGAAYAGYRLKAPSLDGLRRHAAASGTRIHDRGVRLLIDAATAPGVVIEIVAQA
jgi:Glyoxalase-like domain